MRTSEFRRRAAAAWTASGPHPPFEQSGRGRPRGTRKWPWIDWFAEQANVTQITVWRWAKGKTPVNPMAIAVLERIEAAVEREGASV